MTPSLGPALPGFASSTRASTEQAGADHDETAFDKLVERGPRQPHPDKHAAPENPQRSPRSAKAADNPIGEKPVAKGVARQTPPRDPKQVATRLPEADAEAIGKDAAEAASPRDLSLLMAFHDLRHFSAASRTDRGNGAGDAPKADMAPARTSALRAAFARDNGADIETPREPRMADMPLRALLVGEDGSAMRSLVDGPSLESPIRLDGMASATRAEADMPARHQLDKPQAGGGRMEVVSERSFPAPAQSAISPTTATVVAAIVADGGARSSSLAPSAGMASTLTVAVPTHVLKIELHPAELGAVTASLRLSGEQLSIELKPETHEAHRRLAADSEAIVKSLRGLGFDVDQVTILQPSIAISAASRTDATGSSPAAGRDQPSFQPGQSGGNGGSGHGQGRSRNDDGQDFGRGASPARGPAGDDLFI